MNSFTPGIIIAILIVFLVGILVGYSLVQKRFRQQSEALKVSQRRLTEIEQSHELRLREATNQLRHDYETQLASTIEHYQDQLSQKTVEMEQTYETRFRVMQQGRAAATQPPASNHHGIAVMPTPDVAADVTSIEASANASQRELMHLKQQYEIRLDEAAQKLQKSYEQQLAEHMDTAKAEMQTELDQQVAAKYQELEQAFARREADLEEQISALQMEVDAASSTLASEVVPPTPSEIMGTGDETTMTLASPGAAAAEIPELADMRYTQRELDQQVAAATQQAKADFDQRLAEQLSDQQVQLDRRLEELEAEYAQRLSVLEQTAKSEASDPMDAFLSEDGYEDLVSDLDTDAAETMPLIAPPEPMSDDTLEDATYSPTADTPTEIDELFAAAESGIPLAGTDDTMPIITDEEPLLGEDDDLATIVDTSAAANALLSDKSSTDEDLFADDVDSQFDGDTEEVEVENQLGTSEAAADPDSALLTESESDPFADPDSLITGLDISVDEDIDTETTSSNLDDLFSEGGGLAADLQAVSDHPSEISHSEQQEEAFSEADELATALETAAEETTSLELEDALFGAANSSPTDAEESGDRSSLEETASELENDLFGEEDLFGDSPSDQNSSVDDINDLFGDDDFLGSAAEGESKGNENDDDDDDDFGPLDLSDISQLT